MALSKITNDLLNLGASTASLNLPKGTTAQRPSSPVAGMVRENTDDNVIEYYNGTEWKQVKGTASVLVDYLVVAGGGGGGRSEGNNNSDGGGGGGAGGFLTSTSYPLISGTSYDITVGAAGAGSSTLSIRGANGNNSLLGSIVSIGGGGGGSDNDNTINNGSDGGSGGGAASRYVNVTNGGSGTTGQGNDGAGHFADGTYRAGSGGGGAGSVGLSTTTNVGGAGGSGLASSITGTSLFYAAGGGGGTGGTGTPANGGDGGSGIGGNGGYSNLNATSGIINTGSGGGGGAGQTSYFNGASGGAGVVILRLLTSEYSGTTTGSPTVTTDGDYTVLKYTSSGTYTA